MSRKPESVVTRGDSQESMEPTNAKERFYEKLRMPVRTLDIIIGVLVAVLVVVLIFGYIQGHS